MSTKPTTTRMEKDDDHVNDTDVDSVAAEEAENELNETNLSKYKTAGDIANKAIAAVIEATVDGATILSLCDLGDKTISDLCQSVFKSKKMRKGISFPTCVSPQNVLCSLSPLPSDAESKMVIKAGDVVRIELGVHIDGYIAQVAQTVVVGASKSSPVTGRLADVMVATKTAAEAALRLIKPGNTIGDFADAMTRIASEYECTPIENIVTAQLMRNVLDAPKQIVLNASDAMRKEVRDTTFEQGEVYSINLLFSANNGKTKPSDMRTTVYKRNVDQSYQLKMKTSRMVFSQIAKDFGTMAFSLRAFDDENKARMGVVECSRAQLVIPYPIMHEKDDGVESVHLEYTVLLLPNGPLKISGLELNLDDVVSDKKMSDETAAILSQSMRSSNASKKKKKNKKSKASGDAENDAENDA